MEIATNVTITDAWADVGDKFDINNRHTVLVASNISQNNSLGIKYRLLIDTTDVEGYPLPFKKKSQLGNEVRDDSTYQESFPKSFITFKVPSNALKARLQVMADTVGIAAGIIDDVFQIGNYNDWIGEEADNDVNRNDTAFIDSVALNNLTSETVVAADPDRLMAIFSNDTNKLVKIKLQAAAVDDDKVGISLFGRSVVFISGAQYSGEISAIADSGTPDIDVTTY